GAGFPGMRVLIEAAKGTAETADLAITPVLAGQPLDGVEAILLFSPRFLAEGVPNSLGGEPASGVLHGDHIPAGSQECGSPNTDHHRLVLAVGSAFQEHRIAAGRRRKVKVGRQADSIAHGNWNIPTDCVRSFSWMG